MKKNSNNFKIVILIIFIFLTGFLLSFFFMKNNNTNSYKLSQDIVETNLKEEIKEEPIKIYKAKLIGTGDALLHSPVCKAAYDSATDSYSFSYMFSEIKDILNDYDIRYYNQEVIFDDDKPYSSYPQFNAPSVWGDNMINDLGFNLVSLATNHSMDCGNASAKKSAEWWESKENVLATGMASTKEKRNDYKIMEVNGITYTMLSYTYGTNGLGTAQIAKEPYIVNVFSEEKALEDINAVRDKVDILIVAMHWGTEYSQVATETQKTQAKFLADNGVDIILGNHSHSLEPWEWIDDTVVFYSFGNFISNQMGAEQAMVRKVGVIGAFGTLTITKTLDTRDDTKTIKIDNIGADLTYTYRYYDSSISKNNYTVIPFSKMEQRYLNNYYQGKKLEDVYEEFSNVLKKYDDSIVIEPLYNTNTEEVETTN